MASKAKKLRAPASAATNFDADVAGAAETGLVVEFGHLRAAGRWRQLGQILLDEGVLDAERLDRALSVQQQAGDRRLGEVVVSEKLASEV